MPSVSSRRAPYPYWARFGSVGVMLLPNDGGILVGRKSESLENVAPSTYEYASLPPFIERTFEFRRLVFGMGEKTQASWNSQRYRFGINVDTSIGGMARKGPSFSSITPAATGEVRDYVEALHGGNNTLFALAGQYVQRRNGDTAADWTTSRDFGGGVTPWQGARFKDAGGVPVDGLFVGSSSGDFRRYDGAAWSSALPVNAKCVAVLDDELWAGWANTIRKCTSDPTLIGNWAAAIYVGDASSAITWLHVCGSQLFVFKDNGHVYTVNTDGTVNDLDIGVPGTTNVENGRAAENWFNTVWVRLADSFWQIEPGATAIFNPIGPERMLENDSEVRGRVTCSAGHETYFLYCGVYNPANGHSYLLKYGTWIPPEDKDDSSYNFLPAYHGALKKWSSKRITAMRISGVPGTNERLYVGFADGSHDWCVLPKGQPDPMADSSCIRTSEEAYIRWPEHTMMFQADNKSFRAFSAFGPALSTDNYVTQRYRTDRNTVFTTLATNFTETGQRVELQTEAAGKYIDCETALVADVVLEGMALHEQLRPALRLTYTFLIDARTNVGLRNGATMRRTPEQIKDTIKDSVDATGSITVLLPDESSQIVSFLDYQEVILANPVRHGLEYALRVTGVQYKTNTVYGTWDRAAAYTWNPGLTWDQAPLVM